MLDEYGFFRPTYENILEDLQQKTLEKLGYDVNVGETGNIGKLLMIMAYMFDKAWQDMEGSYFSAFVSTAMGESLDRVGTLMGVTRELQQQAEVSVTLLVRWGIPSLQALRYLRMIISCFIPCLMQLLLTMGQ